MAGALLTEPDGRVAGASHEVVVLEARVADGDDDLIAAPLGRIHFAGEHTAGAWAGLMEGALRSGARAAGEVLAQTRPGPNPDAAVLLVHSRGL